MFKKLKGKIIGSLVAFLISAGTISYSQYQGLAPLEAIDALNETSTAPSPGTYLNRTRGIVGQPTPTPPYQQDIYYAAFPQTQIIQATPTPELVRVLIGQRIYCAVSGELLEDVFYQELPKDEIINNPDFNDEGIAPDMQANDLIYTHKDVGTIKKAVIGPASHAQRRHLFNALEITADMNPLEFFGSYVTTDDEFSRLYIDKIGKELSFRKIDQTKKILDWLDKDVIKRYYKEKNLENELIDLWIPLPPPPPKYELPVGFNPIRERQIEQGQIQQMSSQQRYSGDQYY